MTNEKLNSALLASALFFAPATAFADVSLADMLTDDASFSLSEDLTLDLDADSTYGHGSYHHTVTYHRSAPVRRVVYHHRTNIRPVRPVVVVEQPATVVVTESSASSSAPRSVGAHFGMGIRAAGLVPSATVLSDGAELKSKIAGGVGFYLKVRPVRWFSLELINDYLFGHYTAVSDQCDNYFKVPLVVGVRGHIFDYGNLDVYGVGAFSASFVTLDDGNDHLNQEERYVQFGGQFGAGLSIVASGFEIGVDARYTIEAAPDKAPFGYGTVDSSEPVHGFLFSLNVGFAI